MLPNANVHSAPTFRCEGSADHTLTSRCQPRCTTKLLNQNLNDVLVFLEISGRQTFKKTIVEPEIFIFHSTVQISCFVFYHSCHIDPLEFHTKVINSHLADSYQGKIIMLSLFITVNFCRYEQEEEPMTM